ncbi:MAG: hypothetical protein U0990_12685 [Candidatus Nanopelagicales bacterium]|nr:hypothetical protein [Candidatus Nanopelagicales bacterium]
MPKPGAVGPTATTGQALSQAKAIVDRDKPGLLTRIVDYTPGLRQVQRKIHPALKMKDDVLIAWVAEGNVLGTVGTRLSQERIPAVNRLRDVFGEGVVQGTEKSKVRFLGTPAEAKYPATGTLFDIAQNPHLYDMSPVERAALEEANAALSRVFDEIRVAYNVDIGNFPTRPGGMFLSNIEKPQASTGVFETAVRASKSGRAKTRFYETGRERWAHDIERGVAKPFDPIVDVERLLGEEMHGAVTRMAGRSVYKEGLGGLTRMEALKATGHDSLVTKMVGLRTRLQTLRGELRTLNSDAADAIDDFLASPHEFDDMTALREALDIKVEPGRFVAKASPDVGKGIRDLQSEISGVRLQIKGLQPAWKSANAKGYQFVQEGIFRYFPDADAQEIRRLAQVSNNPLLRWTDDIRATAFGGDLSPVSIQMGVAWLSDPAGVSQFMAKAGLKEGKMWTEEAMLDALRADPVGWQRFTEATGLMPLGGVEKEFSVGLIGKLPGVGKRWTEFNESVYRPVMRLTKDIFDNSYQASVKNGLSAEQAMAVAADDALKIIPRWSGRRLGLSMAEQAQFRSVFTSISFLVQPTNLMNDAVKGFIKLGTRQTTTRSEQFAMRRVSKIIAVTEALAVSSSVYYALQHGQDARQAALDALNPTHANFMSLKTPWGARIGLGGPFRSLIRAVVPRDIPGSPVPVPFAGIHRFATSKIGPLPRIVYDEIRNEDFYGRKIMAGDFPLNILQGIEYALSGAAPLTAGSSYRTLRKGEGLGRTIEEALSQFGGTNYIPFDPIWDAKIRWNKEITHYNDIPTDTLKLETGEVSRTEYRKDNPDVDAKLFITGKVSSLQSENAVKEAIRLIQENGIDPGSIDAIKKRQKRRSDYAKAGLTLVETEVDELIERLERLQPSPSTPSAPSSWDRFKAKGTPAPSFKVPSSWDKFKAKGKPEPVGAGR